MKLKRYWFTLTSLGLCCVGLFIFYVVNDGKFSSPSSIPSQKSELISYEQTAESKVPFLGYTVKQSVQLYQTLNTTRKPVIIVEAYGNFLSRVHHFNEMMKTYRSQFLMHRNANRSGFSISAKPKWIIANGDDHLSELAEIPYTVTIILPWLSTPATEYKFMVDNFNLLGLQYYPWTATKQLCRLIEQKSILPGLYVKVFRKMSCNTDVSQAMISKALSYGHMKVHSGKRFDDSYYTNPPENILYLHIFESDSLLTAKGHVISGGIKLVADYCGRNKNTNDDVAPSSYETVPFYDEVFTIKHPPGGAVYHGLLEELPRIAPFVEFLKKHPMIKIHATGDSRGLQVLEVLGFNKSRIVSGPVRARTVYVPRLAFCMLPRVTETQILSSLYHEYIRHNLQSGPRNKIVLIMRSKRRRFQQSDAVELVVKKAARDYGLEYSVYGDQPVPSMNETMVMFYSAVMVVAAHGAGLSNIVFSQPETFVIEVVPFARITPLCYLHLSHLLGQHWHGILSASRGFQVVNVHAQNLNTVIRQYLTLNKGKQ